MSFEYNVVIISGKDPHDLSEKLETALNEFGREGLEVTQVIPLEFRPIQTMTKSTEFTRSQPKLGMIQVASVQILLRRHHGDA